MLCEHAAIAELPRKYTRRYETNHVCQRLFCALARDPLRRLRHAARCPLGRGVRRAVVSGPGSAAVATVARQAARIHAPARPGWPLRALHPGHRGGAALRGRSPRARHGRCGARPADARVHPARRLCRRGAGAAPAAGRRGDSRRAFQRRSRAAGRRAARRRNRRVPRRGAVGRRRACVQGCAGCLRAGPAQSAAPGGRDPVCLQQRLGRGGRPVVRLPRLLGQPQRRSGRATRPGGRPRRLARRRSDLLLCRGRPPTGQPRNRAITHPSSKE